jgi:type II secretory pathway component PulF
MNVIAWGGGLWFFVGLVPICGLFYALYFFVSLPLRRQERVRLFLDLLETGLKQGHSFERTILSAAEARDRCLGVRFHLLAAHLEGGMGLAQALDKVSHFLPRQIPAMFKAATESGVIGKILSACREQLNDGVAQVWKAQNYLALVALVISPAWIFIFWVLTIFVFPKYLAIAADLQATSTGLLQLLARHKELLLGGQLAMLAFFYFGLFLYVGGPRAMSWLDKIAPALADGLIFRLPWRRKRMQRNFSSMLAVLLDAGLPEAKAVGMAAQCAANRNFQRRADGVAADLERGLKLTEAVKRLDDSGEFHWRLTNAVHGSGGFLSALSGWHDALEAKAFQEEQAVAQLITTALVFLNGLLVGLLAVAVFQILIAVIDAGVLW